MPDKLYSAPLSDSDLDRWAWDATCNWPLHANFEPVHDGLNYADLTRCFLWDKVPRAIRKQTNSNRSEFEEDLFVQPRQVGTKPSYAQAVNKTVRKWLRPVSAIGRTAWITTISRFNGQPILYIPRSHHQLQGAVNALSNSKNLLAATHSSQKFNSVRLRSISTLAAKPGTDDFSISLHQAIVQGLKAQGIDLLEEDKHFLRQEIQQQQQVLATVKTELSMLQPSGIFVFTDNHSPSQEYVHVANSQGIPTIMLQHGLDCEHFCLDEAYASTIAVWGNSRVQRYQQFSKNQPTLRVTGNPEYDHLRLPEDFNGVGEYWLWLTRPHISQKCYTPSRHPEEGLDMFDALASALQKFPDARLIIKPHPSDYYHLYEQRIANSALEQRVKISFQPIQSLINGAQVVLSEDSTAALEAMFCGKPLIHLHFAKTTPVLPMVEFGAALSAHSAEMLHDALIYVQKLSPLEKNTMLRSQRDFIEHFAGPCDGKATQRVASLIEEKLVCT